MKNDFQIEITRLYIQILLFIVRTNYVLVNSLSECILGSGLVHAYACLYIHSVWRLDGMNERKNGWRFFLSI
jgi:hypothetical protein